ncbi:MAG: PorV/PorQ family protein [candidate division WOR-3 bacterium]|nr:PorV/PorQ family protein [candidate division WOR-3 bacterium]
MREMIKNLIFLLFFPIILFAQAFPGCVFLMIYPGTRQVGMAGAFSAIADDALATYYNPAGLAFQKNIDFSHHYVNPWLPGLTEWLDIKMYYIYSTFVAPITKKFTCGLFFDYLNSGEIEVWNEKGELLGEYTPYDYALGFSCGYKLLPNLGIGGNFKYIYSLLFPDWLGDLIELEGETGRSVAFDFGLLRIIDKGYLKIRDALVFQNLGPPISYIKDNEPDPLPYSIRIGNALEFKYLDLLIKKEFSQQDWLTKFFIENSYLLIAFDLRQDLYFESPPWFSFGLEISLPPLSFRFGYFEDTEGWRGGVIVEDEYGEQEYISIFEYLFDRKGRKIIKGDRQVLIPYTWSVGINFKFFKIDIGSDAYIYSFPTDNWRFNISLNIGEPIFKGHIL